MIGRVCNNPCLHIGGYKSNMLGLFRFELKKMWRERVSMGLLLAIALAACGYFAASLLSVHVGDRFSWNAYTSLSRDIREGRLQEKALKERWSMLTWGIVTDDLYTDDTAQEYNLYLTALDELEQVNGYQDYLDSIQEEAKKIQLVSIFRSSDSASRNAEKTAEDFAALTDDGVSFLGTHGVTLLLDTSVLDLLFTAVVFLMVDSLLSGEIEEKRLKLLLCTPRGRGQLFCAKYSAGLCALTFFFGVCMLFRIVMTALTYGIPSGVVQTVVGCEACALQVTIGQGIVLFCLLKLFVVLCIYSLVFLLMLILRNGRFLYFIGFGVSAVSLLCYQKISENGYLAWMKWMNPAAFLDTQQLLFRYRNLILFEYPVRYLWLALTMVPIAMVLSVILSGRFFLRAGIDRRRTVKWDLYGVTERAIVRMSGKNRIGGFEFRKWFFYQKGLAVFAVLIAAVCFLYSPAATILYTDEEIYYRQYVTGLEGDYSWEKLVSLYQEQTRLDEIEARLMNGKQDAESMTAYGYSEELRRQDGLTKAINYALYLHSRENGSMVYEKGYLLLFGQNDGEFSLFLYRLVSVLAMTMISILIWGMDEDSGMRRLITATDVGMPAVRRKQAVQLLAAAVLIFAIVYLPWIYSVYVSFPQMRGEYVAYSLMQFSYMPGWITIGMLLGMFYLAHLFVLVLLGMLGKILYDHLKRPLPVALLVFSVGLLLSFL